MDGGMEEWKVGGKRGEGEEGIDFSPWRRKMIWVYSTAEMKTNYIFKKLPGRV